MWLSTEAVEIGKSVSMLMLGYDGERNLVAKQAIVHWREKLYELMRCPYRKPTQVGEERILRPAREVLLRNSAK